VPYPPFFDRSIMFAVKECVKNMGSMIVPLDADEFVVVRSFLGTIFIRHFRYVGQKSDISFQYFAVFATDAGRTVFGDLATFSHYIRPEDIQSLILRWGQARATTPEFMCNMRMMAIKNTTIAAADYDFQQAVAVMDGTGFLVYTSVGKVVKSSFLEYNFLDRDVGISIRCFRLGTSCCGYSVFHTKLFPEAMDYWRSRALLLEPEKAALMVLHLRRFVSEDVVGMVLSFADAACREWFRN